jgi:biopolymer transport protein ExbD
MRQLSVEACAVIIALAGFSVSPSSADPSVKPSNVIVVEADSTVLWNGVKIDFATLDRLLNEAAKIKPRPELHIKPNRLARYDAVAKVIAEAQKTGGDRLGFTGVDSPN